ncbi:hypothetical protein SDC9_204990 [bioreactor metagenome]|uniref:Uncharacterized protein n=1 Tax=bioreactor metagenome TaxID=1076179 RepID=A0A645J1H1_9ZZZZ
MWTSYWQWRRSIGRKWKNCNHDCINQTSLRTSGRRFFITAEIMGGRERTTGRRLFQILFARTHPRIAGLAVAVESWFLAGRNRYDGGAYSDRFDKNIPTENSDPCQMVCN